MEHISEILIDTACLAAKKIIRAKQFDNITRKIAVMLYDSRKSEYLQIPENAKSEIRFRRYDGVLITAEGIIADNTVTIILTGDMLAAAGRAKADVRIINGEEILSGASFIVDVEPTATGNKSGGATFDSINVKKISESEFAKEIKSSNTVYYVVDSKGTVTQYLGDVKLSGGESAPSSAALVCAAGGIAAVGVAENTSSDIGDITIGG